MRKDTLAGPFLVRYWNCEFLFYAEMFVGDSNFECLPKMDIFIWMPPIEMAQRFGIIISNEK